MANALVIVESPAKAKKIQEYLGAEFTVESSIGHIRDLPRNAADVPKAYKGEPWARTGIDVDNGFKPLYVENRDKKDHIRLLKTLLKEADELYLATDEDREGEAIAWHLIEVLNPGPEMPVKRMVFHEITKDAIQLAVQSPRELDRKMVDAQEARRILDRLYGYEVSPVLWKKVMPQLSAGRVQSVATRIVVERERERMAFIEASYWDVKGTFAAAQGDDQREFSAALNTIDGVRLASGRDFGDDGRLARDDVTVLDEAGAQSLVGALDGVPYEVRARETKPYRRRPAAPFITSTYQQEAGRKLGMSAQMAMRAAQGLYEKGLHHLYANRQHHAVGHGTAGRPHDDLGALRQGLPPRRAPPLRHEVEERAGSPRGDPSGGRHVPASCGGCPRGAPVRGAGVRADLAACRCVADDRLHRRDRHLEARRHRARRSRRRVRGVGHGDRSYGLS